MLTRSCVHLIQLRFQEVDSVEMERVRLGFVSFSYDDSKTTLPSIEAIFRDLGFQPIKDPQQELVEKVKIAAVELIHYAYNANSLIRNSEYISERVEEPYEKVSKIFRAVTGTTLEKYLILLKIEKAKELIIQDEHTLSEISYLLGYSSVQYLSNQFKKTTGFTVSQFRDLPVKERKPLENILP